MRDLRPYSCTFPDCFEAGKTYHSRTDFSRHESRNHVNWREIKRISRREPRRPPSITCLFCEEVLSISINLKDLEYRRRHVSRHMEEIAFTVVTKPYEDWDFYTDASSIKYQGTDNPRNTTASHDAASNEDTTYQTRRMQRVSCGLCTEEKTFSGADALRNHMRVVHPNTGGANQAQSCT